MTIEDLLQGMAKDSKEALLLIKCLRGEHESDGDWNLAVADKESRLRRMPVCKHCRCLYVEKA
jgi:hypothetical protein